MGIDGSKNQRIELRVTSAAKAVIEGRAEAQGLSTSQFLEKLGVEGELPGVKSGKLPKDLPPTSGHADPLPPRSTDPMQAKAMESPADHVPAKGERDQWIKATAQALLDEGRGLSPNLAEKAATTQWERAHE